jgi:hypothetical protein
MFSDGASIRPHCLLSAPIAVISLAFSLSQAIAHANPLPSWKEGAAKQSIVNFVVRVTKSGDADFAPQAQRLAALR